MRACLMPIHYANLSVSMNRSLDLTERTFGSEYRPWKRGSCLLPASVSNALCTYVLLNPRAHVLLPMARRLSVGKNRVKLMLKKAGQWDFWTTLAAKKTGKAATDAAKSPDGGIMDMMRESESGSVGEPHVGQHPLRRR